MKIFELGFSKDDSVDDDRRKYDNENGFVFAPCRLENIERNVFVAI